MANEGIKNGSAEGRVRLLEYWRMLSLFMGHMHMWHAARCSRRKHWLTVTNIAATIVVFLFSTSEDMKTLVNVLLPSLNVSLGERHAVAAGIVVGIAAASVIISTMLQYYLRYEERHLEHKSAALEYFNLSNKILRFLDKDAIDDEAVHKLNTHMNFLNRGSPGHFRYPIEKSIRRALWNKLRRVFSLPADHNEIDAASLRITELENKLKRD